ncbi:MAG TPA: hypothetical protein VLB84_12790 [Bacteroidia bacterium]|nr:hypothetical protein [Bacteroidia bacterium]
MNNTVTFFKIVLVTFVFLFNTLKLSAQVGNVDSAFQVARTLAFSSKYDKAIDLCKKILVKTPNYQDVQVLLGRVYFWNGQTDSSVFILTNSIAFKPYKDAYIALSDILRWENKPEEAQQIAENGILNFPDSEELYLRKIKAMYDQKKHKEAYRLSDSLAETNGNAEFRQFAEKIKNEMAKNSAGISYDFDYFDKQFKDPWLGFCGSSVPSTKKRV